MRWFIPGAFGPIGDLVTKYTRGGFESDVVLRQQPVDPGSIGLIPDLTTLQMVTEFFNTQDPTQVPAGGDDWYGLEDSTLKFGKLTMGRGRAFATSATNSISARVYKHWVRAGGRKFLIEEVPLANVAEDLSGLPLSARIEKPGSKALKFASNDPDFPASHAIGGDTNHLLLAVADFNRKPGLVLDYVITLDCDQTNYTFANGQTYYISSEINLTHISQINFAS